jgi:hypothetical protein
MYFMKGNFTAGLDKCGIEVSLPEYDGTGITAYTATARAKGAPVYFTITYTAGQEVTATTPATATNVVLGWAYDDIAAGKIGIFVTAGKMVPILVYAQTALAAGEVIEVINGGVYGIDMGSTTLDASGAAIVQEALTSAEVTVNAAASTASVLKKCLVVPGYTGITAISTFYDIESG